MFSTPNEIEIYLITVASIYMLAVFASSVFASFFYYYEEGRVCLFKLYDHLEVRTYVALLFLAAISASVQMNVLASVFMAAQLTNALSSLLVNRVLGKVIKTAYLDQDVYYETN